MVHGLLEDAFVIDDAAAEQSFITVSNVVELGSW